MMVRDVCDVQAVFKRNSKSNKIYIKFFLNTFNLKALCIDIVKDYLFFNKPVEEFKEFNVLIGE